MIRKSLKVIFGSAIALSVLFIPAGTLAWPEAWILVAAYAVFVTALVLWIRKRDPELYRERASRKKEGKSWDKILLSFYASFLLLMLAAAGLDAVRFRLSSVPTGVKLGAFIAFIPTIALFFWVYGENTFASKVVRVQTDRNQRVIDTGPYRFLRHPMYSAIILMVICIPLALGSLLALAFSGLIIIVFFIRTHLEDTMLQKELPGYAEYAKKTRFRLIPGIW
jgi:protein-S-isoprenylcysteine O-methyltransferase Ste14